jgi:hypothetical protein
MRAGLHLLRSSAPRRCAGREPFMAIHPSIHAQAIDDHPITQQLGLSTSHTTRSLAHGIAPFLTTLCRSCSTRRTRCRLCWTWLLTRTSSPESMRPTLSTTASCTTCTRQRYCTPSTTYPCATAHDRCSCARPPARPPAHPLIHPPTQSLAHSLMLHPPSHLPTHPLTYSNDRVLALALTNTTT